MEEVFSTKDRSILVYKSLTPIEYTNRSSGYFISEGQYWNLNIVNAIPIDEGKYCILLLTHEHIDMKKTNYKNLVCIDRNKNLIWVGEAFDETDVFVGLHVLKNQIFVNTVSCYRINIDPITGKHISVVFTK